MGVFIKPYQDQDDENLFDIAVKNFGIRFVRIDRSTFKTQVNVGYSSSNWISVQTMEKLEEIIKWFKEKEYGKK